MTEPTNEVIICQIRLPFPLPTWNRILNMVHSIEILSGRKADLRMALIITFGLDKGVSNQFDMGVEGEI